MKNKIDSNIRHLLIPVITVLLAAATIIYYVNNPGGDMAARIINYKNVLTMLKQHLILVVIAAIAAILTAVPLGILITRERFRFLAPIIDNLVNIAQTVPSLAVLALAFIFLGIGFNTAVFALWLYALLPILRNTSAGIQSISPDVIDAAKGMGMSPVRVLMLIELPLALGVIMAGVRTSAVVAVGVATLATFIGAGGLGDLIVTGLALTRHSIVMVGGILSALLAVLLDNLLGTVEKKLLKSDS